MKLLLLTLGLGVVGWGIARARQLPSGQWVSPGWLTEQDARDAITRGQSENVTIQFPIRKLINEQGS